MFALASDGDPVALRVVEEEAAHLAHVVAAVTAVLDPDLIVLGGGVGSSAALLAAPMRRALTATTPFAPEIVAGRLGAEAVLAGAVTTALGTARELVFERQAAAACRGGGLRIASGGTPIAGAVFGCRVIRPFSVTSRRLSRASAGLRGPS
ncbi:ROK family protein [Amycolatopsis sp. NPDC004368]